jgi:rubredoxin
MKGGATPSPAPTRMTQNDTEGRHAQKVKDMEKYRCKVCGYVYDPEKGDPSAGIDSDTPFEDLPDDWTCPVCGAGKDQFEKVA